MAEQELSKQLEKLQNNAGRLDPDSDGDKLYKPNKRRRNIRRQVYDRFYNLRDDPSRQQAEQDWAEGDEAYGMVTPTMDPNDWRSHLELPDAFSAIQAQTQETVERKGRPSLLATEESDEPIEQFGNSVMTYNMNCTDFDYQYFLAKLSRTIRGTSFMMDYWRTDKRIIKDPQSVNEDGTIKYVDKERVDFDDDYCEWVPNEFIFIDEKAKHISEAIDGFRREVINIEEFRRIYGGKAEFFDVDHVYVGGETHQTSRIFRYPQDITERDVEVLHYYNRAIDAYWVVANNVVVRDGPLPSKHKELPFAVLYQYRIPGVFWGIGIPKVVKMLSEERKAIRRLNLDRQKINIAGAFLHNSAFDIDDEDAVLEPGRMISIDTNGQPINNAITPLNVGEVPPSYFRTEEILLEDIRRATGIDDRIQGVNVGGTATEAAILKESSLKRVNMISIADEMDAIIRIGRLKWSNIQFFYGAPRMEKIVLDNEVREKKIYRTISVKDRKFAIADDDGKKVLRMEDVQGNTALTLKKEFAQYLDKSYDITANADIYTPISKAIDQTKKTEMFSLLLSNPATLAVMNIQAASKDVLEANDIKAEKWLKTVISSKDMQMLAENENMVMAAGQPLNATPDATEEHTLVHLMYTNSPEFMASPHAVQQIIMDHILAEHDANPATGASADLMGDYGLEGGGTAAPPGMNDPFATAPGGSAPPPAQTADLQATNMS